MGGLASGQRGHRRATLDRGSRAGGSSREPPGAGPGPSLDGGGAAAERRRRGRSLHSRSGSRRGRRVRSTCRGGRCALFAGVVGSGARLEEARRLADEATALSASPTRCGRSPSAGCWGRGSDGGGPRGRPAPFSGPTRNRPEKGQLLRHQAGSVGGGALPVPAPPQAGRVKRRSFIGALSSCVTTSETFSASSTRSWAWLRCRRRSSPTRRSRSSPQQPRSKRGPVRRRRRGRRRRCCGLGGDRGPRRRYAVGGGAWRPAPRLTRPRQWRWLADSVCR